MGKSRVDLVGRTILMAKKLGRYAHTKCCNLSFMRIKEIVKIGSSLPFLKKSTSPGKDKCI